MISSLQSNERTNRSNQSRGAAVTSARIASTCFIRVAKRDQRSRFWLSFPPQTPFRQRRNYEAALRRRTLIIINHRSPEA
jgi:hypothetical protein